MKYSWKAQEVVTGFRMSLSGAGALWLDGGLITGGGYR
jgi:hypothetical protein